MSGSEAEERIRGKAEAALREAWPSGRIVHELMLRQGGCRIDLAAITPDRIIAVEIKSERDVLTRLERQLEQARAVADQVLVVSAAKHVDRVRVLSGYIGYASEDEVLLTLQRMQWQAYSATTNSPARLSMLWASELRRVSGHGGPRHPCIVAASDSLPGAEVRRRVCAALRARPFPRADPPVLSELFPEVSRGSFS